MVDDKKFMNAYSEVVLDNFNSVLKQNFMFQTQIRFHEEQLKELGELKEKLARSSSSESDLNRLNDEINDLKNQLRQKENLLRSSQNSDGEKQRLQKAVNEQMKENASLREKIETLEKSNDLLQNKLKELEKDTGSSKQKKNKEPEIKKQEVSTVKEKKIDEVSEIEQLLTIQSSGGTF